MKAVKHYRSLNNEKKNANLNEVKYDLNQMRKQVGDIEIIVGGGNN